MVVIPTQDLKERRKGLDQTNNYFCHFMQYRQPLLQLPPFAAGSLSDIVEVLK